MPNDADRAQARMLVSLLRHEITEISDELEAAEKRARRHPHKRGHDSGAKRIAVLRPRLYEAHRLLEGLYRRFPDTCDRPRERTLRRA